MLAHHEHLVNVRGLFACPVEGGRVQLSLCRECRCKLRAAIGFH